MTDAPTLSAYLGDNLYADFPSDVGLVRIWAMVDGQTSIPLYMSPDSLAALFNYAAHCYSAAAGVMYDKSSYH